MVVDEKGHVGGRWVDGGDGECANDWEFFLFMMMVILAGGGLGMMVLMVDVDDGHCFSGGDSTVTCCGESGCGSGSYNKRN